MALARPLGFVKAIEFTLPWETGKEKDGSLRKDGGLHYRDENLPTKYGIWRKANPEVDVEKLTVELAMEIYKRKYWDVYVTLQPTSANLDNLPIALATAVFDSGVHCGQGRAIRWLGKGLENKNPTKTVLDLRGAHYFNLVSENRMKYGPNYKGWMNRLNDLRKYCEVLEQAAQNSYDTLEKIIGRSIGTPSSK